MFFFKDDKVSSLVKEYEQATQLPYNFMANTQVKVIRDLCEIGTKDAIAQIARLMAEGNNHEYMDFAFPDTLAHYMKRTKSQAYFIHALVMGVLHGQNETIQKACIRKLVDARCTPAYKALVDYRNQLLSGQVHQPTYWQPVFAAVTDAVTALTPYVEESKRVPLELLKLNQPIRLSQL